MSSSHPIAGALLVCLAACGGGPGIGATTSSSSAGGSAGSNGASSTGAGGSMGTGGVGGQPGVEPCSHDCFYVRSGATGTADGSSWTNAFPALPPQLVRGGTYHLADGSYPAHAFDTPEDGTKPIVLRKAVDGVDHGPAQDWKPAYGKGQAVFTGEEAFSTGYWVVDGLVGGGAGSWEKGFGIRFDAGGAWWIVHLVGPVSHVDLRHLDLAHNGRLITDVAADTPGPNDQIVYAVDGASFVTISHAYLHDVVTTMLLTRGTSHFTLEHSKLARNGYPTPEEIQKLGDPIHREAWSAVDESDMIIRHNVFEDISNTAVIALVNGSGNAGNWQIYGNVVTRTAGDPSAVSTWIEADGAGIVAVDWKIYNNTIAGMQGLSAGIRLTTGHGNVAFNNLWYENTINAIDFWSLDQNASNWFFGNIRIEGCNPVCDKDADSAAGQPGSLVGTADPFVGSTAGDFHLGAKITGPSPVNAGKALSSGFDATDAWGNTRGADGAWDIGAYERE